MTAIPIIHTETQPTITTSTPLQKMAGRLAEAVKNNALIICALAGAAIGMTIEFTAFPQVTKVSAVIGAAVGAVAGAALGCFFQCGDRVRQALRGDPVYRAILNGNA